MKQDEFDQFFRDRTKRLTVEIIKLYRELPKSGESKIIGFQLMRSATSMSANYRAACRARSKAEFFAKLSIVIEEADETLFWLEILEDCGICDSSSLDRYKKETTEILSVMAKARKTIRPKKY